MSILSELTAKAVSNANTTPIHGVMVALYGFIVSDSDEFRMADTSNVRKVAKKVAEKYGGRAYGFRRCFYLKGKQHFIDKGWVYLNGTVRTAKDVLAGNDPSEQILRNNVRINGMKAVIEIGRSAFQFDPNKDLVINNQGESR